MTAKRAALNALKLCLVLVAAWALYRVARLPINAADSENDHDADDLPMPDVEVHAAPIERGTLHTYVTAYGTVQPEHPTPGSPRADAKLAPTTTAVVASVDCAEGEHVEKGQPLFSLDARSTDAAIERAQAALDAAKAGVGQLAKESEKTPTPPWQMLRARQVVESAQASLESARTQRRLLEYTAPLSGTVIELLARPGETLLAGATAVEVTDLDRLVVAVNMPGPQLQVIRAGQPAWIEAGPAEAPAGAETSGGAGTSGGARPAATSRPAPLASEVTFVDPWIDPATGMGAAEVRLPPEPRLRPGQFAQVRIAAVEHKDVMVVPADSLGVGIEGTPIVYLVRRDLAFHQVEQLPVAVGAREGDRVEIRGPGLAPGDLVVTRGAWGLPKWTKIHIAEK